MGWIGKTSVELEAEGANVDFGVIMLEGAENGESLFHS